VYSSLSYNCNLDADYVLHIQLPDICTITPRNKYNHRLSAFSEESPQETFALFPVVHVVHYEGVGSTFGPAVSAAH